MCLIYSSYLTHFCQPDIEIFEREIREIFHGTLSVTLHLVLKHRLSSRTTFATNLMILAQIVFRLSRHHHATITTMTTTTTKTERATYLIYARPTFFGCLGCWNTEDVTYVAYTVIYNWRKADTNCDVRVKCGLYMYDSQQAWLIRYTSLPYFVHGLCLQYSELRCTELSLHWKKWLRSVDIECSR